MGIVLAFCFVFYTLLSWVILFRDAWTLEVLGTKFYPQWAEVISQIQSFLTVFKLNTLPTFLFAGFIFIAFLFYFLAWRKKYSPKKIILFSILFQIVVFFSYPILSTDVLNYILSDRVSVVYHQNVWTTKPNIFNNDPYYFLVYPVFPKGDWNNQTRIYGPVNQVVYSAVTAISGNDFLINLVAHKLVVLIFNLATIILVYFILKKYYPEKINFALIFLFWNPLFILETVGSGHNDIIMIFFILLSYLFFLRKNPILVGLCLALAVNVKITAIFLAPLYFVVYFGRNLQNAVKFSLLFAVVALILFSTMGTSIPAMVSRTLFSTTLYWQSLPQQLGRIFPSGVKLLTFLFLLFYLRQLFSKKDPLVTYGKVYLFYLLIALGAYWNWYSLWVLMAFAFLGNGRLAKVAAVFTFTSALAYPLYWISLRFNYQNPLWAVIIYLIIVGGPVVVYLHDKTR